MAQIRACFVVEAEYAPDAATRREPFRGEHLERVVKLIEEGALVVAGARDDMSASLLVFDLDHEESVAETVERDVYWREGVWTSYSIRKLNRVLPDN